MSLRYRYHPVPMQRPIHSLGGRRVRPRPLIDVLLIGPTGSRLRTALLDTGADDTIFPESLASLIGIDLTNAPTGANANPSVGSVPLRYSTVTFRLTDGRERREWTATVGFTPTRLIYLVLGFAGFLQFFTATFFGAREEVELSVNSSYPGT